MDTLIAYQKPPASELVADQLRMAIQLGRYLPGDRFPPERELSEQLGVSRTTLREAGRLLAGEGLVEARHGRSGGLVVQDHSVPADVLRRHLKERMSYINTVFDYRITVEAAAARFAAQRRTDSDLRSLNHALEVMDDIIANRSLGRTVIPSWKAADAEFHACIARAARNSLLEEAVIRARAEIYQPVNAAFEEIQLYMHDPHRALLQAIRAKDPDQADLIMKEHIEETRQSILYFVRTGKDYHPKRPVLSASETAGDA